MKLLIRMTVITLIFTSSAIACDQESTIKERCICSYKENSENQKSSRYVPSYLIVTSSQIKSIPLSSETSKSACEVFIEQSDYCKNLE